jgi:hypothetical protein
MMSTIPSSRASINNFFSGFVPVISANRLTNGILWALQRTNTLQSGTGTEVLHAYDATNLANELYNSNQAGTRDIIGMVGRNFESITVANGKVYVPTGLPGLTVFGLLTPP